MVLSKQAEKLYFNVDLLSPLGVPATYLLLVYFYAFHFLEMCCVILQMHEVSNNLTSGTRRIHTICSSFSWLALPTTRHKYTDGKVHTSHPPKTKSETGCVVYQPATTPFTVEKHHPYSTASQHLIFYLPLSVLLLEWWLLSVAGPTHHPEALHNWEEETASWQ